MNPSDEISTTPQHRLVSTPAFTAEDLIHLLNLEPLEGEGGMYRNNYTSTETLPLHCLPLRFRSKPSQVEGGSGESSKSSVSENTPAAERPFGTAIYYLLTADSFSHFHQLKADEVYHFYLGDPVELCQLHEDGSSSVTLLGNQLFEGMALQQVVPAGIWQGLRLKPGGSWALLGTTMAPGYHPADYTIGSREALIQRWPDHAEIIRALTGELVYR
ncbi:cupin domain-containing protein [Anoxynatronum sibiricum]|uniref:Cupin domain-containing protein n=1 Tax=Anoxynatronum sibiricum TaxID=210623 RepID=A0ABU9VS35_9CLOT